MKVAFRSIIAIVLVCSIDIIDGAMNKFIKFKKMDIIKEVKDQEKLDTNLGKGKFVWDAQWPRNFQVILLGRGLALFQFGCYTETLEPGYELQQMRFCFTKAGRPKCETVKGKGTTEMIIDGNKAILDYTNEGGKVKISSQATATSSLSSLFFCEATNQLGTVKSNKVQIVDLRTLSSKAQVEDFNYPTRKLYPDGPIRFDCVQKAIPLPDIRSFTVKYGWKRCDNDAATVFSECDSAKMFSDNFQGQILPNGSLFIPYFRTSDVAKLKGERLICEINSMGRAYFKNKIEFMTSGSDPKRIRTLKIIYPKPASRLVLLDTGGTLVKQTCNFLQGPGTVSVTWKHKGPSGDAYVSLSTGWNEKQSATVKTMPHHIEFKGKFKPDTAGEYVCEVSWQPEDGSALQKKSTNFFVDIKYYPTIAAGIVPRQFVVDGNNASVDCSFENPFPKMDPAGNGVTPGFGVNGEALNTESEAKLKSSIQSINGKFSKVMNALSVGVLPLPPQMNKPLKYTSKKMEFKSSLSGLSSSHQVQCIGKNKLGETRADTILQVVPKPIVLDKDSPSKLNCSQCSATKEHTLRCVASNKAQINSTGVIFSQFWKLGSRNIAGLLSTPKSPAQKYLKISDDGQVLTIKQIDDSDFKDSVNKAGKISCVIFMAYPKSMTPPKGVETTGLYNRVFYNSETDDDAQAKRMTTTIKLTNIAPRPRAAGAMWVIPVALACIVVLIVISLIVVCCRKRTVGETYNVDEKEKQQGNDPETENAEKEAFPVYERPEDGPIRGSRASLDDSIQVGSDDEDEVLAEYDVDIGKFDEEGSFIGQYATNEGAPGTGTAGGNRRLPNVANNTEV